MGRVALMLLVIASTLHGASTAFSTCSDGTITLTPCSTDPTLATGGITGSNYTVNAWAGTMELATNASLFPPDVPNIIGGRQQQALADTVTTFLGPVPPLTASANASDVQTYISGGPARPGFLQLEVLLGYIHEASPGVANADLNDGTHDYFYSGGAAIIGPTAPVLCNQEECLYSATVPFELGTTFQVSVSANSVIIAGEPEGGHDGGSTVLFGLFDANGSPVPFSAVPEPGTGAMLAIAAGVLAAILPKSKPLSRCKLWRRTAR